MEIEKISEEENILRALCNECYELGEQGSHRMYNPHNFKLVLSKMGVVEEFKKRLIEEVDNIVTEYDQEGLIGRFLSIIDDIK